DKINAPDMEGFGVQYEPEVRMGMFMINVEFGDEEVLVGDNEGTDVESSCLSMDDVQEAMWGMFEALEISRIKTLEIKGYVKLKDALTVCEELVAGDFCSLRGMHERGGSGQPTAAAWRWPLMRELTLWCGWGKGIDPEDMQLVIGAARLSGCGSCVMAGWAPLLAMWTYALNLVAKALLRDSSEQPVPWFYGSWLCSDFCGFSLLEDLSGQEGFRWQWRVLGGTLHVLLVMGTSSPALSALCIMV
ncbi:hypothetical protein L7F22_033712, partial [Adiantum nelumboides]|nr:hypothetical protein [Adiantum nelumboides]